jgi:hypothetical protein
MLSLHAIPLADALMVNESLTQRQFATLLRAAMKARNMGPAALSRRTADVSEGHGVHQGTISARWARPDYSGPTPEPAKRRMLEQALGVPKFYLEGIGIPMTGANLEGKPPTPEKPPRSAYDPTILSQIRDAGLAALARNLEGHMASKRGKVVDYDRAIFWLNELFNVAVEVQHAPSDTTAKPDEHERQG